MAPRRHAPLWYYLYYPTEYCMHTLKQKFRLWRKSKRSTPENPEEENVKGKVVIITGANTGLGKQTAKEMARKGAGVIMACRDLERGEQARKEIMKETGSESVELYRLDLSDLSSVRSFATLVMNNHPIVDILINNAGICLTNSEPKFTKEQWELTMTTNHLGPFLLTNLLLKSLQKSSIARVVTLSSTLSIISTLDMENIMMTNERNMGFQGLKPYSNSKLANALFTQSLAKKYPEVKSFSVCPGFVKTEIFRHFEDSRNIVSRSIVGSIVSIFGFNVEEGAQDVLFCALSKKVEQDSGKFFRFEKPLKNASKMLKEELADKLWNVTEQFVSLHTV